MAMWWSRDSHQLALKATVWIPGLAGALMIMYALWMLRIALPKPESDPPVSPTWFPFTFFGLGVTFFLITCSGHIAAQNVNSQCLSCYTVVVLLLIVLEVAITADVFLNENWEKDFPEDPSGKLIEFKNFVKTNFDMCKWVSLFFFVIQAISILLAVVLRDFEPPPMLNEDSDDDNIPVRLPLLRDRIQINQT